MAYIGAGISRFNTADELTVTGTSEFGGNVSFGDNNITNVGSLQIDSIAGDADTNTNITFAGSDVITMTTAGSERLRLDASGNVGIGTTAPHDLFHVKGSSGASTDVSLQGGDDTNDIRLFFGGSSAAFNGQIIYEPDINAFKFSTVGIERLRIDSSGNLLVGRTDTSSTTAGTVIYGGSSKGAITQTFAGRPLYINRLTTDGDIIEFAKDSTTVGNIASGSSGNVFKWYGAFASGAGLGVYSNVSIRPLSNTGAAADGTVTLGHSTQRFKDGYFSNRIYTGGIAGENDTNTQITFPGSDVIKFLTGGGERMRIDASGNVLVGKTATGLSTTGFQALATGNQSAFISDGDRALILNRKTSDGSILEFRKDSTTVGSVGSVGGLIQFGQGNANLKFSNASDIITPANGSGTDNDNALDLGSSSARFKDLYLSGGVVFGATGGAVTSKTLDDYEEGTFTASLGDDSTTAGSATGNYTKVGNQVFIKVSIGNVNTSSLTGSEDLRINGLPFTPVEVNFRGAGVASLDGVSFSGYITSEISGGAYIKLVENASGASGDRIIVSQYTSGSADIWISLVYTTNS